MFESFAQLFPVAWQGAVLALVAPMRWLAEWQSTIALAWTNGPAAGRVLMWVLLLLPALLLAAGAWSTVLSFYTLPFRSGRGTFLTSLLMAWWDAGRCIWLFWTGILRVGIALIGWIIGSVRFGLLMVKNILLGVFRSPLTLFDWMSRSYFKSGLPWVAFLVLVLWCAIEATIFTFTLQPTLNEVFAASPDSSRITVMADALDVPVHAGGGKLRLRAGRHRSDQGEEGRHDRTNAGRRKRGHVL